MIEKHNISYGSIEPAETVYETDHVIKNFGIRKEEHTDPETGVTTYEWVAGSARFYTYKEYAELQDALIAEQRDMNAEQDELIAEILEVL